MSEGTNNVQDYHASDDSSTALETANSVTPPSTMIESISDPSTSPDDVEVVPTLENSADTESIMRIKDSPDDEPIEMDDRLEGTVPILELPKKSSSVFPPKQSEVIPIEDSLSTNSAEDSKVAVRSRVKRVRFCIPDSPVPTHSKSTRISPSKQSFRDTATISGRFPNDTMLNIPDCLEGLASRLLPGINVPKSCGAKAKKRSFAKAPDDRKEPGSGASSPKRRDLDTSKFQGGLLNVNPIASNMLEASRGASMPEKNVAPLIQQFKMFTSEDPDTAVKITSAAELSLPAAAELSADAFIAEPSAAEPSSATIFTKLPNITGPSTRLSLQDSLQTITMAIRKYIRDKWQGLLEQLGELVRQKENWQVGLSIVPPCLEQDEQERAVGSRSFPRFHEETTDLVDRLKNLIDDLVKISNEMVSYLSSVDWQISEFKERLIDYLRVFNSTNNSLGDLQKVIIQLRRDCINYESHLHTVNILKNSSEEVMKCIIRIISFIAGLLACIRIEY